MLKKIAARTALVVASLLVGGMLVEAGLRIADGVGLFATDNFIIRRLDNTRQEGGAGIYDPLLGWTLKANYQAGTPENGFTTGEFGVRMNGFEIRPVPRGGILAVGDSFTAGSEVGDDQSWPAHLERILGEPVVNAASGAWGVDQMVLRAEQLIPELEPHALIVGILDQDILRNDYVLYGAYKPYFVIENGALALEGTPAPRMTGTMGELGRLRSILGHFYTVDWAMRRLGLAERWYLDSLRYRKVQDRGPEISCLLMKRLAELKAKTGIRVVVLFEYGGNFVLESPSPADWTLPVVDCARAEGLEVLDAFAALKALATSDPRAFRELYVIHEGEVYGHMSSTGNRFIAELLKEAFF